MESCGPKLKTAIMIERVVMIKKLIAKKSTILFTNAIELFPVAKIKKHSAIRVKLRDLFYENICQIIAFYEITFAQIAQMVLFLYG